MQKTAEKSILLVDDDMLIRTSLKELFEKAGFRVALAANGVYAMTKLKSGFEPDLIVTDLMMPGMNGHDFIKGLRADDKFKGIPVMLMTGTQEKALLMNTVSLGLVNLFVKPLDLPDVLKKTESFFALQTGKLAS